MPRVPVRLTVLLMGAMGASAAMPFVLGALAPLMTRDLSLSARELGLVAALHYAVAAGSSSALGRRIDAIGPRVALGGVYVVGGSALLLAALASSFWTLLPAAACAGAAAAGGNPASNRIIAALPGPRGALTGLKQSGVQVGGLLVAGILPPVAGELGWRVALAGAGCVCVVGVLLVRWLPEQPSRPAGTDTPPASRRLPPALRRLAVYAFCMGVGQSAVMAFLPLYGAHRVGLADTTAGVLLAVVAVGATIAGVAWGVAAERRTESAGNMTIPLVLLAGSALAATGLIAVGEALGAWTLWAGAVVLGLGGASWNAVVMLALIRTAPPGTAGHASGRVLTAFFVGLCLSAPTFGALVDATGDYLPGWILAGLAFAAAAAVARPGGTVRRRHDERDAARAERVSVR